MSRIVLSSLRFVSIPARLNATGYCTRRRYDVGAHGRLFWILLRLESPEFFLTGSVGLPSDPMRNSLPAICIVSTLYLTTRFGPSILMRNSPPPGIHTLILITGRYNLRQYGYISNEQKKKKRRSTNLDAPTSILYSMLSRRR